MHAPSGARLTPMTEHFKTAEEAINAVRLARADLFNEMAAEIVRQHDFADDVSECGYACAWVEPYGWVPEADCPIHDAPRPGS